MLLSFSALALDSYQILSSSLSRHNWINGVNLAVRPAVRGNIYSNLDSEGKNDWFERIYFFSPISNEFDLRFL